MTLLSGEASGPGFGMLRSRIMPRPTVWTITSPTGRVHRFPTRSAARSYSRAHGGSKAGYHSGEYLARIEPKLAAGMSRAEARGHPPGGARHLRRHKTKTGQIVREQWVVGEERGPEVTLDQALSRLQAFRRAHPNVETVGVALHGRPYHDRLLSRWIGFLWSIDDLINRVELGIRQGLVFCMEIQWTNRPLWESIDVFSVYEPGPAA